jgi:hypothetical protein
MRPPQHLLGRTSNVKNPLIWGLLMRHFGIFASLFCALWLNACAVRHYNQRVSEAGFQGNLTRILIVNTIEPGVAPITVTSFREEIGRTLGACGIATSDLSLHRMMLNQRDTLNAATASFRPDLILTIGIAGTVLSWPSPELVVQVSVAPPGGATILQVSNLVFKSDSSALGKGLAEKTFSVGKEKVFRTCSAPAPRAAARDSRELGFERGEV